MSKNRDTKKRDQKRAERQKETAGPFPFHRIGKAFYDIIHRYRKRRIDRKK